MSDQSEPMGRSDEEGEEEEEMMLPMKPPAPDGDGDGDAGRDDDDGGDAGAEEEADDSFLDEDFLSFGAVDNGGSDGESDLENGGANGGGSNGRKRGRSPPPAPNDGRCAVIKEPAIPWLDGSEAAPQKPWTPPPQPEWGRNNRGYGNQDQYRPPPPVRRIFPLIRLHNEIVSFVKLMEPTAEELKVRERMVGRVTEVAHKAFGKDKVRREVLNCNRSLREGMSRGARVSPNSEPDVKNSQQRQHHSYIGNARAIATNGIATAHSARSCRSARR